MDWNNFFSFKQMASSQIIKLIYILGAIFITIGGLSTMFGRFGNFFMGLIAIILGNLVWRVICEGIIIMFSIHERLIAIERNQKENSNQL